jgi:hypothetical protein
MNELPNALSASFFLFEGFYCETFLSNPIPFAGDFMIQRSEQAELSSTMFMNCVILVADKRDCAFCSRFCYFFFTFITLLVMSTRKIYEYGSKKIILT